MRLSELQEVASLVGIATCVKLLLVPTYHSTDFEVHRNWLAITHSLPLKNWYSDESSEWTLDYPPFFAYFEFFLSIFASLLDPQITHLQNGQGYASNTVILFQRVSVMVADVFLYWGVCKISRHLSAAKKKLLLLAVIFSPGLFIVDHIHFQYNGFLLGMLLLSLAALQDGHDLLGGFWFAVLVCFKHLFAVAGPIYFVYLLRHYCRGPQKVLRFFKLAGSVVGVLVVAFGPFAYYNQIPQVIKRLFPFGRGLCHAYWAPNIWALYNIVDKAAAIVLRKIGVHVNVPEAALTGGLVGDFSPNALLPQITPKISALLVVGTMLPCLVQAWRHPRKTDVARWVVYAYACGFMFGWHVHEKASLHMVIPFSILAVQSLQDAGDFIFIATVATYSLFPLLFEAKEYPIKVLLLVLYILVMWVSFAHNMMERGEPNSNKASVPISDSFVHQPCNLEKLDEGKNVEKQPKEEGMQLLSIFEKVYLAGLVLVEVYGQVLHPFFIRDHLPFLPLMLISGYCSIGMLYFWAGQLFKIAFMSGFHTEQLPHMKKA
ncbi:hypothetical protein CY35_09G062200 [Sphagnum magellanicum]|nr:hypothetical protein CY35_09G062200 [Sphagnum magellanicum]